MGAENTITLEAEGDPSVFNMTMKVLRPESGPMIILRQYDLEDAVPGTYTVSFNVGEGVTPIDPITNVEPGSTITAPTEPTKTGYTFGGWYKESTYTNTWNFSTDTVEANTTLYAKWTEE